MLIMVILVLLFLLPFFYFGPIQKSSSQACYDVCIVLGYPAKKEGTIHPILQARMDTAIRLYYQGIFKKIIVSGGAVKNEYIEAEVMKAYALQHGFKESQILLETKARNTHGNIQYAKQIMAQHRLNTAIIITSPWQLRKANRFAKEAKLNYAMWPSMYPKTFTLFHILGAYLYSYLNLYRNFIYALIKK